MGPPKQRWTSEEKAALRAGVERHGVGKWRAILQDPQFCSTLCHRSNVDLKDKWRNMITTAITSCLRERRRIALREKQSTPENDDHAMAISTVTSDVNDKIEQKWTSEEKAALRAGVAKYGVGKWNVILKDPQFSSTLCYRSNIHLKDKWRNMTSNITSEEKLLEQRWTSEEQNSLRAGVAKHGVGKWNVILKDPEFCSTLCNRSNIDLKDKWRNMTVGTREKGRNALKKTRSTHINNEHAMAISTLSSDISDMIVDENSIAAVPIEGLITSNSKQPPSRLDNMIMEAIKHLNEPMGSRRTSIANYIKDRYFSSSDLKQLLSAKLKDLATSGKLMKVNRRYRIAPISLVLGRRSPKILLLKNLREPSNFGRDNNSKTLTRSQVDAELAHMATLTAEEAEAAATRAVAEAEAMMAEAEAAVRDAEAAEANAQAAQTALMILRNRNATNLVAQA